MSSERSFRNRIIEFQNQAAADFSTTRSATNLIRYVCAFAIFMGSTVFAGVRYPFARLLYRSRPAAAGCGTVNVITRENIETVFADNEAVLLDVWAQWCGPCMMMNPILEKFAADNPDILVGKIDADRQADLVDRFRIRGLPQILLIKNGREVKRNAGALSHGELSNFVA
ncbi:MAG: thioredoxin family protein [Gammaproteobacteria bacterium]